MMKLCIKTLVDFSSLNFHSVTYTQEGVLWTSY